jgi:glycosyltransferase involved in cell wall biosynthesis
MTDIKRILIALPNDKLGGAEQFLQMIATAYAAKGYELHVFFITARQTNGWQGLPVNIKLYYGKGNSEKKGALKFIKSLYQCRKIRFDKIFTSHTHITGLLGLLRKCRIIKARYFIGRESTSIFKRFKGIRLAIFRICYYIGYSSVDLLICQTDFMKQQLMNGIPRIAARLKVVVLHNPVDLEKISMLAQEPGPLHSNYIVSAGRLIPEKGFDILINSFSVVHKQFPELELLILGEGPLRPALENLVAKLGLTGKVKMPGRVENVFPYFKQAVQCVVSSRIEGFPNVLLQMMSQNGNVVSTLCAGGIEHIPALPTCMPNDWKSLSEIMISLLKTGQAASVERKLTFNGYLKDNSLTAFVDKVEELLTIGQQEAGKSDIPVLPTLKDHEIA